MPKAKPKNKQTKGKQNVFTKIANKFNSMGKASQVLVLTLMIGIIGGGGFAVYNTYAASTSSLTSNQCYLLGRMFSNGTCAPTCISGAGSFISATPYSYCSGAIDKKITQTNCNGLKRVWINNGCAKRWQQTSRDGGIPQCNPSTLGYKVNSTIDNCYSMQYTSPLSCTITYTASPKEGLNTKYSFNIKNNSTKSIKTSGSIYSYGDGKSVNTTVPILNPGQSITLSASFTPSSASTGILASISDWTTQNKACSLEWDLK